MKKIKTIILVIIVFVILIIILMPGALGSGSTNIRSEISIIDTNGRHIRDADVIMRDNNGVDVIISKSDQNGIASINVVAGWSICFNLIHTEHSAKIYNDKYYIKKDGYCLTKITFPSDRMYWHSIAGFEIGRPKLKLTCTLNGLTSR